MAIKSVGNWNDLPWQVLREGAMRKLFTAEGATAHIAEFRNGHETRPHKHHYEQIAMILEGECDYYLDGVKHRMTPGGFMVIPPDTMHYIHVYDSSVPVINLDIFIPKRDEYVDSYNEFVKEQEKDKE
jgi:quercetin dioxygenase-like cupin family protein